MEQIKTEYIEEQIARTLGITTVAHFTIKAAKTINIRLPNIELQNQFAAFVEQTNKSKYHGEFTYEMEVAA
jgi:restriction endonuclease S subunit